MKLGSPMEVPSPLRLSSPPYPLPNPLLHLQVTSSRTPRCPRLLPCSVVGAEAEELPEISVAVAEVNVGAATIIIKVNETTKISLQVQSLTKRAPRPVRMSRLPRARVTGRRGKMRLIVPIPWCASGSTSSSRAPPTTPPPTEILADLVSKI